MGFAHRIATPADVPALRAVMAQAIDQLQAEFLGPAEIAASHRVMGLDEQLVRDGTYFVVESGAAIAGCGGWSFRDTLYGGDDSIVARTPTRLDPTCEAARIRAMYTHPDFVRRGVGRMILALSEAAARAAGFRRATMMATLAGVPLYRACGYRPVEELSSAPVDGVRVPLVRMEKPLA